MRCAVWGLVALSAVISAQSLEVESRFEVVSVKGSDPSAEGGRLAGNTPGTFRVDNFALRDIILTAYAVKDYQLVNAPEWTRRARFDIVAKYPEGADPTTQRLPMLRNVLRERFNLVARRETRDMPMLRLVMARTDRRLGPQLTAHDLDCPRWFAEKRPQVGAGGKSVVTPNGTRLACAMMGGRDYLTGSSQTMTALAGTLANIVGLPVMTARTLLARLTWI